MTPEAAAPQILALLKTSDRNLGELHGLVHPHYPTLTAAVRLLCQKGEAEYYFTETQPPVLTYRIKVKRPTWNPFQFTNKEAANLRQE